MSSLEGGGGQILNGIAQIITSNKTPIIAFGTGVCNIIQQANHSRT